MVLPELYRSSIYQLLLVIVIVLCLACCGNNVSEKKPMPVPANYVDAIDTGLSKDQDTVFYRGKYFSGYIFHLYATLDTAFSISFLNGMQEGMTRKWYANKQIAEERLYINGKKEGVHKAWWEDGKPKFEFDVTNDAYCGELKEWYASGRLAKDFHYNSDGQEEGRQQLWWADGRLRANYVVKKGRKYGSIGVKLCLNPNDSIYKK